MRELDGGYVLSHSGVQPGVRTSAVRTSDGITWVVAFNGLPKESSQFGSDLNQALWRATEYMQARYWPRGDVMDQVP